MPQSLIDIFYPQDIKLLLCIVWWFLGRGVKNGAHEAQETYEEIHV